MESLQPHVVVDPDHIELQLRRGFSLSTAEVRDIGTQIHRGFIAVSALHPKGHNGTRAWAEGTAQLRATLIPKGWSPEDPHGQPRIVAPNGRVGITVSSGDAYTGVANQTPQTRNNKGAQTVSSVQFNARQPDLFPLVRRLETVATPTADARRGQTLWILLYYLDLDAGQLRIELSRPTAMSDGDRVNGWSVRYILPPMPLLPDVADPHADQGPDIDFDVVPKQS